MKILGISGSLRENSYNHQLALAAAGSLKRIDASIEFEILEWSDVPLFNQDKEFPPPDPVARIRESVISADGVWFFTPEYNHSYPGALKNLIDWLSRPASKTEGQVLFRKPVAFCGTSIGMSGTAHAQEHLVLLLSYLGTNIMNTPRLVLPYISKQTDEEDHLELDSSMPYLDRQAQAFITHIKECPL